MPQDQVIVYLTTPEAELFKSMQQFHSTFALLCSSGVFDTKNGSCEIHFDSNGEIKKIEKHVSLYDSRIKA